MPACCCPSTPASPPGPRSFSSPARFTWSRCCSAASAAWCGRPFPAVISKPDHGTALEEHAMVSRRWTLFVIASFSILGDLVKNVGGDRLQVGTLVGPNGNAHVYAPSPGDAKSVADAKLVFVNGLGFEGWIDRLVKASGTKAPIIVATKGIKPRERAGAGGHDHDHGPADPHAWQSVANAKVYVANIRDALIAADPAGKDVYAANAAAYLAKLDALEQEVRDVIAKVPADRRRVITSHAAFVYFQDA